MNRPFNKIWKETLLVALCFFILGGFLILKPELTKDFFAFVSGAFVFMLGVLSFLKHRSQEKMFSFDLAYAIVCIVGAIILFMNRNIIFQVIPWVLGAIMIANCIFKLQYIFELKKAGIDKWYLSLVFALMKLILGIVMILGTDLFGVVNITTTIGWLIILFAIFDVFDLIMIKWYLDEPITKKQVNQRKKEMVELEEHDIEFIDMNEDA